MNLKVEKSVLKGSVNIPPSKSMAHRAVICAVLAEICTGEKSSVKNIAMSEDIKATIKAMEMIGSRESLPLNINCNESGSTLRFIIPIAAALGAECIFHGEGRLNERPIDTYIDIFEEQEMFCQSKERRLPLHINGRFKSGTFKLKGNITSQYISGLLFALPLLEGNSVIHIEGELESRPYVDLTVQMLEIFGIKTNSEIMKNGDTFYYVNGSQTYRAADYTVEGDYSQAAFWEAAKGMGMDIEIKGLSENSLQGDKAIIKIAEDLKNNNTEHIIDVSQIPDLVPAIAVMGAFSKGSTYIVNGARLRIKESDRLKAVADLISALGGNIEETQDGLVIKGDDRDIKGGSAVDSYNDHRIAMAAGIAALKCSAPIIIKNAECVRKSYPDFWEVYRNLGGIAHELDMG